MAQHEPNMVPTWPKMSQHSQRWPKINPIWSQLLPYKDQRKPQNTVRCKIAQQEPKIVPMLAKKSQERTALAKMNKNDGAGAKTAPSASANQKLGLHTPPRAKLHQLTPCAVPALSVNQRCPSSKFGFAQAPQTPCMDETAPKIA